MKTKTRVFSACSRTATSILGIDPGAITICGRRASTSALDRVVDLHAITVFQDPAELTKNTREGDGGLHRRRHRPAETHRLQPESRFRPCRSPPDFNCVARLGWLNRMTQFKDKAGKNREKASAGLYAYPILKAADILLYHATHVPVGEDQKQHIELVRDIAQKFNDFGATIAAEGYPAAFFPPPEPLITGPATVVMKLRDGTTKMSKAMNPT